jgi:hypothetical protein
MTEFLNFDSKDFTILEEFEFDETIQRPEAVRFYTLDEQIIDAFEKFIPPGKVSTYKLKEIAAETDKIRNLYEKFIVPTEETYILREPNYGKKFDWIFPVYSSDERKIFDYTEEWSPLFTGDNPGFYMRMLSALPKPYTAQEAGIPYAFSNPTMLLDNTGKNPIIGLPEYITTKFRKHEDGRVDIIEYSIAGTSDSINTIGYYAKKRPLNIPNPFPDHPFLKDNNAVFIETTSPLKDVVPSLDAIITHAVPVTTDPYGEGMNYLKIYDVSLADIPWSAWKSKFPQAEAINSLPEPEPIEFSKPKELAPPKQLLELYRDRYSPGVSVRRWLMDQIDGGDLVVKMLLSDAGKNGSVNIIPGIDLPEPSYPDTTAAECSLLGLDFNAFTTQGVFRKRNSELKCVPLEFLKQERKQVGYRERKTWKEDSGSEILKEYLKRLETYRKDISLVKNEPESKSEVVEDSELRKEVVAILEDDHRLQDDKFRDISELVRSVPVTNHLYLDPKFILCEHSLALLRGDLEKDRREFNDTWTKSINGYRVCKFCGERVVAQDYVDQETFDESGFALKHSDTIEEKTFSPTEVQSFTTGLRALSSLFDLTNPAHDIILLICSLLQVLPEADQISTILKMSRDLSIGVKPGTKSERKQKGIIGIAAACIMLQIHIPMLIPRRSFGPNPLVLSGYPRDEDTPGKFTIVDSMFLVIRRTFMAAPTAFKGPSADVIRAIINEKESTRKAVFGVIGLLVKGNVNQETQVKIALENAKRNAPKRVVTEQPRSLIPTLIPPEKLGIITGYPPCSIVRPFWSTAGIPRYSQMVYVLPQRVGLTDVPQIFPSPSERVDITEFDNSSISKNLKLGVPKEIKINIKDDWRTNVRLATRLATAFQIDISDAAKIDPTQDSSLLRDISKGLVYKVLDSIKKSAENRRLLDEMKENDISLYVLLADLQEEKKKTNTLRAVERATFTDRMRLKRDIDREITKELLDIGIAPYIITNKDREVFASELSKKFEEPNTEEDIGVGLPRDPTDDDLVAENIDNGDYGDARAVPFGRDYEQPDIADDGNGPI